MSFSLLLLASCNYYLIINISQHCQEFAVGFAAFGNDQINRHILINNLKLFLKSRPTAKTPQPLPRTLRQKHILSNLSVQIQAETVSSIRL